MKSVDRKQSGMGSTKCHKISTLNARVKKEHVPEASTSGVILAGKADHDKDSCSRPTVSTKNLELEREWLKDGHLQAPDFDEERLLIL
jgi:hypothetical protein